MPDGESALLLLDLQQGVVERYSTDPGLVERVALALDTARRRSMLVVHVSVRFRSGHPEVDPANRQFSALKAEGLLLEEDPAVQIHPALTPRDDEPLVVKHRVGAFHGTDLEVILRANRIDHLVLAGIATSGAVLSTVRAASDMDLRLTILRDGCTDPDPLVHDVLVERVFPKQADVVDVAEWVDGRG
ncbi:MAG: cysteine hydrolase family protein [Acidimicrobiia bacterium]